MAVIICSPISFHILHSLSQETFLYNFKINNEADIVILCTSLNLSMCYSFPLLVIAPLPPTLDSTIIHLHARVLSISTSFDTDQRRCFVATVCEGIIAFQLSVLAIPYWLLVDRQCLPILFVIFSCFEIG